MRQNVARIERHKELVAYLERYGQHRAFVAACSMLVQLEEFQRASEQLLEKLRAQP